MMKYSSRIVRLAQEYLNRTPSSLRDKRRFHAIAEGAGLPVPKYYGQIERVPLWPPDLPDEFVVKPVVGVGRGIEILSRVDATVEEALRLLEKNPRWIVEGRVYPHESMKALSETEATQSVRLTTVFHVADGSVSAHLPVLKIIVGDNTSDNINEGATGNLVGFIDPATGTIQTVVTGDGRMRVTRHPVTDWEFAGYAVPSWGAYLETAARAARAFASNGTVGWDIAVSNVGPVSLEGNVRWRYCEIPPEFGNEADALATALVDAVGRDIGWEA